MRAIVSALLLVVNAIASANEAATTCSTTAATVSTYTASTTYAAVIEYADCTTKVVRVLTASDGTTQLDLSNKQIVYVKSLPSVMQLNLKSNSITQLQNVSIPSTVQTLDLSKNSFSSLQNFAFPSSLTKFTASNGKLVSLYNFSFPDSVTTLNLSNNPIASIGGVVFPSSLKVLSITSTVKLIEFEVRRTDATLFESLQTFNVSATTSLTCSDSDALVRYVQETLLCVLEDDVFDIKYGIKSESSASGSVDGAVTPAPVLQEANNPRRSKFLVFAAISLFLACIGLMSTLAPRTLYDRYQKKKLDLLKKNHELLHVAPTTPSVPRCGECEADTASLRCEQCDVSFCASCDANVHKFKSLQKHTRVNLSDKAKAILQVHEHDPNIGYWDL